MEFPTGELIAELASRDLILEYVEDVAASESVALMKCEADQVSLLNICGE
jgi:hypothetical protein